MLSGIGDASDLRRLGIDVVENLPGVGQDFQDQVMVLGIVFKYKGTMPERRPDFKATVRAIELARELGRQTTFDDVCERKLIPGPNASKGDIEELARAGATSFGHPVGGCKIGVDEMPVVDLQLCVRGINGLRVADSSVMPRIPTGPTNAPTFMVAGKAAQLILA
jgi:choline dehydrogenase-like flavoprotein